MTVPEILAPVFVQVALVFVLLFWMGARRLSAVRDKSVRLPEVSTGQRVWPERAQWVSNAFSNQFELPVLFYAVVAFALVTRKADLLFMVLSWVFVATRIVHAGIYVTVNDVPKRFGAFLVGALVLVAMWILFALRILVPGL